LFFVFAHGVGDGVRKSETSVTCMNRILPFFTVSRGRSHRFSSF
jgi:hypothetical protein